MSDENNRCCSLDVPKPIIIPPPTPPFVLETDFEQSSLDGGSSSATFVDIWTSGATVALAGEVGIFFLSVLVNNRSSTSLTEIRWLIETVAGVTWTEFSPFYPSFSMDNFTANTVGFPSTSFYQTTIAINNPTIKLQQRSSSGTPDITEPKLFWLKTG